MKKRSKRLFERGEEWLAELPHIIEQVQIAEGVHFLDPFTNLSYNYVTRAVKDEQQVVVKIGIPGYDFTNEVNALRAFPKGAIVSLLTSNTAKGYYIMENIKPGITLNTRLPDTRTNVRLFVEQWRRLHLEQSTSSENESTSVNLPHIDTWFEVLSNDMVEIPRKWLTVAKQAQRRLKDLQQDTNLHGDLHHENILWDDTLGWTIIDPKGVIGHAYYDCVQFLFNKNKSVDEFMKKVDWMIHDHEFDEDVLMDAINALGTVYLIWAYEDQDPEVTERYQMMEKMMRRNEKNETCK